MSEQAIIAFKKVKKMRSDTTKLSHIQPNCELCLVVYASAIGIGAVQQQKYESEWKPISFFTRKLTEAETRCNTFSREMLATFAAIRHYRQFLEGQQFHILTDHKPLLGALKSSSEKYSPREIRQIDYILRFTSDIKQINGVENVPAYALSHVINSFLLEPSIDIHTFSKEQQKHLQRLLQKKNTALQLEQINNPNSSEKIICDTNTREPRSGDVLVLLWVNSWHRMRDSSTFTSTSPDHFRALKDNHTCWSRLTKTYSNTELFERELFWHLTMCMLKAVFMLNWILK